VPSAEEARAAESLLASVPLAEALHERLVLRWPETVAPDSRPGVPLARLPRGWDAAE